MSCILIKNDGIGDLVMVSGIISEISKFFGGELDLVTCKENEAISKKIFGVRNSFFVSRDDIRFSPLLGGLGYYLPKPKGDDKTVLREINKIKYDYAICLRRFIRQSSLIIMNNVRAINKLCCWQFITNTTSKAAKKYTNGWQHFSGDLSIVSEMSYFKLFLENKLQANINPYPKIKDATPSTGETKSRTLGIALGGLSSSWPISNWLELIYKLEGDGWRIILFGGIKDRFIADAIKAGQTTCEDMVGKLSFSDSVDYLKKCRALIGNDTGFTHFASLIVQKCLIILGGGTFNRFLPWPGAKNQYAIFHGLDCYDCDWRCKYKQKVCLSLVTPSKVLDYFYDILEHDKSEHMRNLGAPDTKYRVAWRRVSKSMKLSFNHNSSVPSEKFS